MSSELKRELQYERLAIPVNLEARRFPRTPLPDHVLEVRDRPNRHTIHRHDQIARAQASPRCGRPVPHSPDQKAFPRHLLHQGTEVRTGNLSPHALYQASKTGPIESDDDLISRHDDRHAHLPTAAHQLLGRGWITRDIPLLKGDAVLAKELLRTRAPWSGRRAVDGNRLLKSTHRASSQTLGTRPT